VPPCGEGLRKDTAEADHVWEQKEKLERSLPSSADPQDIRGENTSVITTLHHWWWRYRLIH